MKRETSKTRIIALIMAIMTILTAIFSSTITTFAADYKGKIYVIDMPRGNDTNRNGWGHPALQYMNGWKTAASSKSTLHSIDSYTGPTSYCIEPGVSIHTGNSVTQKGEDFWDYYPSDYNHTIAPSDIQRLVGRIGIYGWSGNNSLNWVSTDPTSADHLGEIWATQILIHETIVGERDSDFNKINANNYGCNNILDQISSSNPCYSQIMNHYYDIEAKVKQHIVRPSFCAKNSNGAPTLELQYDGSKYTASITDTNNVLSNYNFSSSAAGVSLSKSGNVLTISTETPPAETFSVNAEKVQSERKALITWTDNVIGPNGSIQDTITYGQNVTDPVYGVFNVKVSAGNCNIVKESEDGYKAGFQFQMTGNGVDKTVTTGSDGRAALNNIPAGTYTVTEINTAGRYVQPASQTVTINGGQTATVTFSNKLKRGLAMFQKTDLETGKEIESKDGVFGIYEWNTNTKEYSRIAAMSYNEGKSAYTTAKLPVTITNGGWYKIVEEQAPTGYVRPTNLNYEFQITQDEEIHKLGENGAVVNAPQKGKIRVKKTDSETKKPLANAVYSIVADGDIIVNGEVKYKSGTVVDTITTGKDGIAESKELYLGKYIVFEKTATDGYVIDETKYKVTLAYQGDTVDVFTKTLTVTDQPQKGNIEITKQGEVLTYFDFVGTEFGVKYTPVYEIQNLANATYEIYALNDVIVNGDVKYKKGELVDTVTTSTDGKVISKDMYLGSYLIREIKAPTGFFIGSNEYEVTLSYQGQTVEVFTEHITSENQRQHMKVQLTKMIEENPYYPNSEAYQDIIFGIYTAEDIVSSSGEVLLEKDSLVDCFGIDDAGQGIGITDLPFAKFYCKELQTAEGYVLNKNIYPFEFSPQDQTIPLLWIDLNENDVEITNETIKGRVEIRKKSSLDNRPLPGAVYGIYRESDDMLIQELTTQNIDAAHEGYAISDLLPYGKYYIREITPSDRYHNDQKKHPFFIGENGEETITLEFELTDEPIIGALLPFYTEKGLKEFLSGSLIPQTGAHSYFTIALNGLAVSAVVLIFLRKKQRKQN